jgi:hypothetical protein
MEYMFFLVNTKIHKHIRLGDGRDRCMSLLVRTGKGHVCHIRNRARIILSLGSGICGLCLDGRVHGLAF